MLGDQERVLVYGMQSSGASLTTLLLAQLDSTVAVLDLWCGERMPSMEYLPRDRPLILKMTISTTWPMEEQVARFAPTRTLLVLRHPAQIYVSLATKYYRDSGGRLEDKLRKLEQVFQHRDHFDALIHYEDVIMRPATALEQLRAVQPELDDSALALARTPAAIVEDARRYPWLDKTLNAAWAAGNIDAERIEVKSVFKKVPREVREIVASLCPNATRYHDEYCSENISVGSPRPPVDT